MGSYVTMTRAANRSGRLIFGVLQVQRGANDYNILIKLNRQLIKLACRNASNPAESVVILLSAKIGTISWTIGRLGGLLNGPQYVL